MSQKRRINDQIAGLWNEEKFARNTCIEIQVCIRKPADSKVYRLVLCR
ncbi:MAG: hypothetical protein KIT62_13535 [Cyclobacteriaceae bacterium]|nr:hypothetical protein [Cyclobacteriaceae bacterium]